MTSITKFIGGGWKQEVGKETSWERFLKVTCECSAEDYEKETGLKYDMVEDEITGDRN